MCLKAFTDSRKALLVNPSKLFPRIFLLFKTAASIFPFSRLFISPSSYFNYLKFPIHSRVSVSTDIIANNAAAVTIPFFCLFFSTQKKLFFFLFSTLSPAPRSTLSLTQCTRAERLFVVTVTDIHHSYASPIAVVAFRRVT